MTIELPKHHQKQSDENLVRINAIKQAEANLLQFIDADSREGSIARTNIEQGVMWAIRGIAKPKDIEPKNVKVNTASYSGAGRVDEFKIQNSLYSGVPFEDLTLILPRLREGENEVAISRGCEIVKFSELPAKSFSEFDLYGCLHIDRAIFHKVPGHIVAVEVLTVDGRGCQSPTLVKNAGSRTAEYKIPGLHFTFNYATGCLSIIRSEYETFGIGLGVAGLTK